MVGLHHEKIVRLLFVFWLLNSIWVESALAQTIAPASPPTDSSGPTSPGGELPPEPFLDPRTGEPYHAPQTPPPIPLQQQQSGLLELQIPSQNQAPEQRTGFVCDNAALNPQERQQLWDETLKKGFVGKELGSGAPKKDNRKALDQNAVVIPDEKGKLAIKQEIPNQKIDPDEVINMLNTAHRGAFAFGLLLPDSLRAGRCKDPQNGCSLLGENLEYRNSGAGIIENYRNAWNDLWAWFKPDQPNYTPPGISKADADLVKGELISTNEVKQVPLKTAQRTKGKIIPNSILSDSFSSNMNSNCTSAACHINTYSMFDKLFNAYSSGSMLITSFGPTFLNSAKRAFMYLSPSLRQPSRIPGLNLLNPANTAFGKRIRSLYSLPDSWYNKHVVARNYYRVRNKALQFDNTLVGAQRVLEGGGFDGWWTPAFKKELEGIKDPTVRGDYFRYFSDLRSIAHSHELARQLAEEEFENTIKALAPTDPLYIAAKRKYAFAMGKSWREIDDITGIDVPQWHLNHKSVNWQKYAVKTHTGEFVQPAVDSDYYDVILAKMGDGHFEFSPQDLKTYNNAFESTAGKLNLYAVEPHGQSVTTITRDTIEDAVARGNLGNMFARLDNETYVPLQSQNLKHILNKTTGDIQVFRGGYAKTREVSVDELADLITSGRGRKPLYSFARNTDVMLGTLREQGFQYRENWGSLLDRYFAQYQNIFKGYLDPKGGALKLTAYPFLFWGLKRGFNNEAISLYQLPDSWTTLDVEHGQSQLFDNAFIDFFANEGSDQGDIFVAFLNKLPWKVVLDKISKEFNPINEFYQSITSNELRNQTGSLALYVSGPQHCEQCLVSIQSKDFRTFSPFFSSPQSLQSFILEDTPPDQKDVGQTLIAYTSHTNLRGNTKDIKSGNGIDLEEAIRNQETCTDAVKKMNAKIPFVGAYLPTDSKSALPLVFGETLGYAVFTWAGFLGSALQQTILAPELQDCVDTKEGYFIHFFAPKVKDKADANKKDQSANLNTTKVSEAIQDGSDKFFAALQGDPDSWTGKAAQDTKKKINTLVQNAETKDLVEAVLKSNGVSTGQFSGSHVFYFWCEGGCEVTPTSYRTKGKEEITDGKTTVTNDFEKGTVNVNAKPVITNPDIARLATTNTAIPAEEYPNTITKIGLPSNLRDLIFRMDSRGHMQANGDVLNCIKQGVLAQTGVGMQSNDLTEAFGLTDAVVTDTHPNIYPQSETERIVAEGVPRKMAQGASSHVDIFSNTDTELVESLDHDNNVGHMKSIQLRNGVILYKPSTNELIVWLKRNEKNILNQNEVTGLKAKPTTSTNPLTNCKEPAIDLSVSGDPSSEQIQEKVRLFNDSLAQLGPFKIFDTPSKRFIFYSGPPPECQPRFKVIDKATGQTLVDAPIKSIEATPNGVKVTTEDGKTHDLGFSVENGKPILTYNGQAEPLLTAQGEKGAFWYDPQKGLWYTENAQLLPLLEAFRNNGLSTQVGPDGKVSTTATGNLLNVNIGSANQGGFNLPSLPDDPVLLGLFMLSLIGVFVFLRMRNQ